MQIVSKKVYEKAVKEKYLRKNRAKMTAAWTITVLMMFSALYLVYFPFIISLPKGSSDPGVAFLAMMVLGALLILIITRKSKKSTERVYKNTSWFDFDMIPESEVLEKNIKKIEQSIEKNAERIAKNIDKAVDKIADAVAKNTKT